MLIRIHAISIIDSEPGCNPWNLWLQRKSEGEHPANGTIMLRRPEEPYRIFTGGGEWSLKPMGMRPYLTVRRRGKVSHPAAGSGKSRLFGNVLSSIVPFRTTAE